MITSPPAEVPPGNPSKFLSAMAASGLFLCPTTPGTIDFKLGRSHACHILGASTNASKNLIEAPEYRDRINSMRNKLEAWMEKTDDHQ
ncbi:MAG: hypothetical protein CBC46_03650 [Verrucomicrobiaceae bacterium TMED86]|nr:MAG: hypothetical protein CBC46_03650 [Verrucomicrobiaceae bacterium TMED86]